MFIPFGLLMQQGIEYFVTATMVDATDSVANQKDQVSAFINTKYQIFVSSHIHDHIVPPTLLVLLFYFQLTSLSCLFLFIFPVSKDWKVTRFSPWTSSHSFVWPIQSYIISILIIPHFFLIDLEPLDFLTYILSDL